MSVCVSVHVCVRLSMCLAFYLAMCLFVFVHDNSKNNGSIDLKLEHIIVYENRHCPIKVEVAARL